MAEQEAAGSANPFLSINTLLAVITLVGGFVLVSPHLFSERPPRPAVEGTRPLGVQNIESRLWEDPFAAWSKLKDGEATERRKTGFADLKEALTNGSQSPKPTTNMLVLGIMVSGQPYAEDEESRVRARYAVGAALGVGGYKPVTSDHIGLAASAWPSSQELEQWLANTNAELGIQGTTNADPHVYCPALDTKLRLRVPFEVYEAREYFATDAHTPTNYFHYGRILLVWLDEEYFDDDPATRLALFQEQIHAAAATNEEPAVDWAIVGPSLSSTLRSLVERTPSVQTNPLAIGTRIRDELKQTRLILATPNAMDEVLMESNGVPIEDFNHPRRAIASILDGKVFKSVTNCACTDAQMAHEAIAELKLRRVDLANSANRLVLISEWDTFFARMSNLAYAAELLGCTDGASRLDFIAAVRRGNNRWPTNLDRFVYLQGLDGEAADTPRSKHQSGKQALADAGSPAGIEELLAQSQDFNKPEGASQFDYLTRMGDQIVEIDRRSRRQNPSSHVAAVGIIGLDVYDTLLILQALRDRLPEAIFFTTGLDARLWQPDQLEWSRNLVVLSSYGLRLRDSLQPGVPPFRDSNQCAEYLATLNAIESEKVKSIDRSAALRFEIGRYGAVPMRSATSESSNEAWLHPSATPAPNSIVLLLLIALAILAASNLFIWRAARDLLLWPLAYVGEPLRVASEDVGTHSDIRTIFESLMARSAQGDEFAQWMLKATGFGPGLHSTETSLAEASADGLIEMCNTLVLMADPRPRPIGNDSLIDRNELPNDAAINATDLMNSFAKCGLFNSLRKIYERRPLADADLYANRRAVNEVLEQLSGHAGGASTAARAARAASISMYKSRLWRRKWFVVTVAAAGVILGAAIWQVWQETYVIPNGEPFNFAGTSAWPTEFIRIAVFVFSMVVIVKTQRRLKSSTWELTRRYRFNLDPACNEVEERPCAGQWPGWRLWREPWRWSWRIFLPDKPVIGAKVAADVLWSDYQRTQHPLHRSLLVAVQVVLYLGFGGCLIQFTGQPFSPIRGDFLCRWDFWLLFASVIALLSVTFWIIEVSRCCAWFIRRLTQAATTYPPATVEYFKQQRAVDDGNLVEEWIDLQLIADLTAPIGKLIYWPFFAAMLMLLARIHWLDRWSWPWPLLVILTLNVVLAAASSILLRQTAVRARKVGLENLETKVNARKRNAAKSLPEHESNQAEMLLNEIKNLRRGAFAPVLQSPLVSALLMNSSGIVFIQVLAMIFSK